MGKTRALGLHLFLFLLAQPLIFSSDLRALPAQDVRPINNRDYLPSVLDRINKATKSIRVMMYLAQRYENFSQSPPNQLLLALAQAQKRGVEVQVILERPKHDNERSSDLSRKNKQVEKFLTGAGIVAMEDSPKITTHAKVLVIDTRYIIIGSTNWTYAALALNNEASVMIDSPAVAKVYEGLFEQIKEQHE